MSVREETGARKIPLAASDEWNGVADARAALHVARRDRLAASGTQLRSADGGVSENIFLFSGAFSSCCKKSAI